MLHVVLIALLLLALLVPTLHILFGSPLGSGGLFGAWLKGLAVPEKEEWRRSHNRQKDETGEDR